MDPFLEEIAKHMVSAIEDPGTASATEAFVLSAPSDWPMTIADVAVSFAVPRTLLISGTSAVPGLCALSEY